MEPRPPGVAARRRASGTSQRAQQRSRGQGGEFRLIPGAQPETFDQVQRRGQFAGVRSVTQREQMAPQHVSGTKTQRPYPETARDIEQFGSVGDPAQTCQARVVHQ